MMHNQRILNPKSDATTDEQSAFVKTKLKHETKTVPEL